MDWHHLKGTVAMVTGAAHQSVASWKKCVFKPLFLCYLLRFKDAHKEKRQVFSLFVFWKLIISHQIINLPEGKKDHRQVRCLNQGRWSLFTCIHNYRKHVLNPRKLKRFFIYSDYRVKRRYGRDLRRAAPEERRAQQITGSRRSGSSENSWLIKSSMRSRQTQTKMTLTPSLTLLSPTGATKESKLKSASWEETGEGGRREQSESCWRKKSAYKAAAGQRGREEAAALGALSSSWLESRKSLMKSCFDKNWRSRSSQMKMTPLRSWESLQLQLRRIFKEHF